MLRPVQVRQCIDGDGIRVPNESALAESIQALEKAAAGAKGEVGACVVVTDPSDAVKAELKKLADKIRA